MKSSKNKKRSNRGIDAVELYLRRHEIPFEKIDDSTVVVGNYGTGQNPVTMMFHYDLNIECLGITVSSGMVIEPSSMEETMEYIGEVNDNLPSGGLFICPDCSVLHFLSALCLPADEITDEWLFAFIGDSVQMYIDLIQPFTPSGDGWSPTKEPEDGDGKATE